MAASSSRHKEDAVAKPFCFDVILNPFLIHANGPEEKLKNQEAVYEFLKDITTLNTLFEAKLNATVVEVTPELTLTLSVSSFEQFYEIKQAIDTGGLEKLFLQYVVHGLELDMLEIRLAEKDVAMNAETHFGTPSV
ncbi:uncharacterized protein LOC121378584 [Gigantopelta aegis]|uniref:uncharacterized protein LOC121378584 n=1 Tax=Gigantopelta aegis TaxID=1735272 RepID=UPI001B887F4E|nr:uncharacterized protein LOC121378584 [Gigantopelta aegis]